MKAKILIFFLSAILTSNISAQHNHSASPADGLPQINGIEPQPVLAQALRVMEALTFMGNALPAETAGRLKALETQPISEKTTQTVQALLDPYCLAMVEINPESRVKVIQGPATPVLMQEGWTSYLVKIHNEAHITASLSAESPNAMPVLHRSTSAHRMKSENALAPGELDNRFLEVGMYHDRPMKVNMSGLGLEYAIIQIYARAQGIREAKFGFNVGQGSQDIGFRNTIDILFDCKPAVKVVLNVTDENEEPTMASFIITDGIDRFANSDETAYFPDDYRLSLAMARHWEEPRRNEPTHKLPKALKLNGIYPLPSRRLAGKDRYPDFFFQPQIYRADGESIYLPPGKYHVTYSKGPEYKTQQREITIPEATESVTLDFKLERWIHMAELGWYSADHHIHAAGCSHYESPEEGVLPEHMWRQIKGEDLNLGSNLTWGPSWYYQKQFFTGKDHPLSNEHTILRYDVEVSGFPSSHAGHIVLLNLKEDDYPGTTEVEQWPSWTLPILTWAKSQGGLTGYAHSGWGLAPVHPTDKLPNYEMPKMDGIGANEYVVTVTHDVVDFYSAGDTPAPAELNMWYHTLNCGFRTRLSGETDFPCISDERVGRARIYANLKKLDFSDYMDAIKEGKSYVSDGYSHLIDFRVNNTLLGDRDSEVEVRSNSKLNIKVKAVGLLTQQQDEIGRIIASRGPYQSPYWHIERARVGTSRRIPVELVVNGEVVETKEITADGTWNSLEFTYQIQKSSWIAFRVYQSAHTNPLFVIVDGKPILEKKSVAWCRAAVDQCWKMKVGKFREEEISAAKQAYDHARKVFDDMAGGPR